MQRISLCGKWRLSGRREGTEGIELRIPDATVPGCPVTELSRVGILPRDLFLGESITLAEKYEDYEWWYECDFEAPPARENVFLVFRGVDCLAEYSINGQRIGSSDNMLIPHEFDVGAYLREGKNTLTVHLSSSLVRLNTTEYGLRAIGCAWGNVTETGLRRAPHTYGWDIMPRAVDQGIWREVFLECRDRVRFGQAFFDFTIPGQSALLYELDAPYAELHDLKIELEAHCKDSVCHHIAPIKEKAGRIRFHVPDPKLWWPYGYGEANVYDATLRVLRGENVLCEEKTSFGIRSVRLERTDMTDGESGCFRFLVNGVEIMCRGSNWVPLDAYHHRDASRYAEALALVKDIGCNILRCWGGNVYEDHAFFDFCDRNGIMVWQDFAMACRPYPMTDEYADALFKEATSVIREYRHHPSIILWSGDNECDSEEWSRGLDPNENRLTREVLARAVAINDIGRPYLPSSPYISEDAKDLPHRCMPEWHLWGSRDYYKSDYYRLSSAHFVSETGYHGCPSMDSVRKFINPDKVWPYRNNSEWILHSSDQKGNDARVELMAYQVRQMFATVPQNAEDFALASQISQAEAMKFFIERMRIGRPHKSGIIWWNLLDGWPQFSDAVVDYYFEKKLAYYYIKRAEAPFAIIMGELYDRFQPLFLCNDTLSPVTGHVTVEDSETGETVLEKDFCAPENATTRIGQIECEYHEHKLFLIRWESSVGCGFNHYLTGFIPHTLEKYRAWIKKYKLDS